METKHTPGPEVTFEEYKKNCSFKCSEGSTERNQVCGCWNDWHQMRFESVPDLLAKVSEQEDKLNTEKHLVQVYKKQAECAQEKVSEQEKEIELYREELKHLIERRDYWKGLAESKLKQVSEQSQRIQILLKENEELKEQLSSLDDVIQDLDEHNKAMERLLIMFRVFTSTEIFKREYPNSTLNAEITALIPKE